MRLVERDGATWADPLPGGSATLSNVVFADGLVRVDAATPGLAAGDPGRRPAVLSAATA